VFSGTRGLICERFDDVNIVENILSQRDRHLALHGSSPNFDPSNTPLL
jgi:hypothetical protein